MATNSLLQTGTEWGLGTSRFSFNVSAFRMKAQSVKSFDRSPRTAGGGVAFNQDSKLFCLELTVSSLFNPIQYGKWLQVS